MKLQKYLSKKQSLATVIESPSLEDRSSESSTGSRKKVAKCNRKHRKSVVQKSLENALNHIADNHGSKTDESFGWEEVSKAEFSREITIGSNSGEFSVETCSTVPLSDDDDMDDLFPYFDRKHNNKNPLLPETPPCSPEKELPPLLRGTRRWEDRKWDEEESKEHKHFLYSSVRRKRRDAPPVCPVREESQRPAPEERVAAKKKNETRKTRKKKESL